jgi:alpha-L-fucosidase
MAAPDLSERAAWWIHDRFGMFIHWGLYALPARHEWVKNREEIPDDEYQTYFDHFDPDLYDPAAWARSAREAGMRYVVLTTKHHEGFCLWDSALTDYKAPNTPCGRDLLRPFVDAFRAEGIRIGFYYSLIDWHHPDFTIDCVHPMRNSEEARATNPQRDMTRYAAYMRGQVRELLTNYGPVDYLFFDFSYPGEDGKGRDDWESKELLALVRELQPNVLVNDRLDLMGQPGGFDFTTPEQVMVRHQPEQNGEPVLWETCQTFTGSWGYHRDEATWKSVKQLLTLLIDTVSKNGNLLLNVGPTARGEFDDRALDRLQSMGTWLRRHGRAVYGCGPAPDWCITPQDCRLTYNAETNRLYVHVLNWPIRHLHLDGLAGHVAYAQLLHDGSEVPFTEMPDRLSRWEGVGDTVTLELPVVKPNVEVPVIEIWLA